MGCGVQGTPGTDAGSRDPDATIDGSAATASLPAWAVDGDCPSVELRPTGTVSGDPGADSPGEWIVGVEGHGAVGVDAVRASQRCAIRASVGLGMEFRESFVVGNAFVSVGTRPQADELARRVDVLGVELNGPLVPL